MRRVKRRRTGRRDGRTERNEDELKCNEVEEV
jgi:hypothetical protein